MRTDDLTTPALLVDADALEANLADMAARWPGARLRPHVKAHKTTAARAPPAGPRPPRLHLRDDPRGRGHGRRRSRARPAAGQRGARHPPPRRAGRRRRAGDRRRRLPRDRRRRGRRRGPRGAGRRQRRAPPLRRRPRARRVAGRPRPRRRPHRARRDGLRGPPADAARPRRAREAHRGVHGAPARRARRRRRRRRLRRRHRHRGGQHLGHRAAGRFLRADGHRLHRAPASRSARR